jgi:endogenous inhibitor of DNA gyrase (YacG/DUF329 family)
MIKPERRAACVACGKPATPDHAPFCSQGCKDRDLLQWLSDGYRIPGPPIDDEEGDGDGVDRGENAP